MDGLLHFTASLMSLDISKSGILNMDNVATLFQRFTNLCALSLEECSDITDLIAYRLSSFGAHSLLSLDLSGCALGQSGLRAICDLSHVYSLKLRGCRAEIPSELGLMTRLETLDLSGGCLQSGAGGGGGSVGDILKALTQLKQLILDKSNICPRDFQSLTSLQQLKE